MDETPWSLLNRWTVAELRRRADILGALSGVGTVFLDGGPLVRWASGGGDETSWLFAADGRVLLLVFDHESRLNLYSDYDVATQVRMYAGVPEELVAAVRGLPDESPFLMMGDGAEALPAASGVFWFDGSAWHPAEGLAALVLERGLDLVRDTGIAHGTSWYLLDREFTPDALMAAGAASKFGVTAEQLIAAFSVTS